MDHKKLQVLAELIEEYRAECAAVGLRVLALKAASVRNAVSSDVKDRKRSAVVVITEGRTAQPAPLAAETARRLL